MDRRSYLKSHLGLGLYGLIPASAMALVGCSGAKLEKSSAGFDGRIMGTGYSVRLSGPFPKSLEDQVKAKLLEIDGLMSTWKPESELSQFNDYKGSDWQKLNLHTISVISQALDVSKMSQGAFDVTVGALVDLWGFGAGASAGSIKTDGTAELLISDSADSTDGAPSEDSENRIINNVGQLRPNEKEINRLISQSGFQSVEIDPNTRSARKLNPAIQLDLSGIAKGYAVDQVASVLDRAGIENYLVEVGGELRSRGKKLDGTGWRVAIEQPKEDERDVYRVINLNEQAIATSGDYRHFYQQGDQRFSHSIDPRTGYPVRHDLASVSVIADSAMLADALSTTLMVLGTTEALTFANENNVAAQFIRRSATGLEEFQSERFKALTG